MRVIQIGVVIIGAVVITALGIDAADSLTGSDGTMLGQLIGSETKVCPEGMVEVPAALSFTCIDQFEGSAGEGCSITDPSNQLESATNLSEQSCGAVSEENRNPWRNITREQAQVACARAEKRLPSNAEWYQAALGTVDDENCNIDSNGSEETGSHPACVSAAGAQDLIGNVWEWVTDDVIDGQHDGRALPAEGYVGQVNSNGIATITTGQPDERFNEDYFWSSPAGVYAVLRGGFYGSGSDAGLYTFHGETLPTTAGVAIGFRCVK